MDPTASQIMQWSIIRTQTIYYTFENPYLIHYSIKSHVINSLGKRDKNSIWEKIYFLDWSFDKASKYDPTTVVQRNILGFILTLELIAISIKSQMENGYG